MNASLSLALAAVALVPAAISAQPTPQPGTKAAPRRVDGMSEAGNAIFATAQTAPDPDLLNLARQQRQLRDQLSAASLQQTIDVVRIEELLRKSEEVQGQVRTRNNDRLLAVLRELPEADRSAFLRAMLPKPGTR